MDEFIARLECLELLIEHYTETLKRVAVRNSKNPEVKFIAEMTLKALCEYRDVLINSLGDPEDD